MNLQERIDLMIRLGEYILSDDPEWQQAKENAYHENAWFIPAFTDLAVKNIATEFLEKNKLQSWVRKYGLPAENDHPKSVGIVMAGNIPLVGFHDFLCVIICGHRALIKTSSKDAVLIGHLVNRLYDWEPSIKNDISFAEILKGCDAYIATGSNNSGRYFEYYFARYPHIIRRNRTSVAVLDGTETKQQLHFLADDIQLYFGLGCRNVTKLYVPENYDFLPLLNELKRYDHYLDFHKYKHNYDYQLALLMMSTQKYMNSGAVLFSENSSVFSAVSHVHYEYYQDKTLLQQLLQNNNDVQCIVGNDFLQFGNAQQPSLTDYADGIDTMQFLMNL